MSKEEDEREKSHEAIDQFAIEIREGHQTASDPDQHTHRIAAQRRLSDRLTAADKFTGLVGAWKQIATFGVIGVLCVILMLDLFWASPKKDTGYHQDLRDERAAAAIQAELGRAAHRDELVMYLKHAEDTSNVRKMAEDRQHDTTLKILDRIENVSKVNEQTLAIVNDTFKILKRRSDLQEQQDQRKRQTAPASRPPIPDSQGKPDT